MRKEILVETRSSAMLVLVLVLLSQDDAMLAAAVPPSPPISPQRIDTANPKISAAEAAKEAAASLREASDSSDTEVSSFVIHVVSAMPPDVSDSLV